MGIVLGLILMVALIHIIGLVLNNRLDRIERLIELQMKSQEIDERSGYYWKEQRKGE